MLLLKMMIMIIIIIIIIMILRRRRRKRRIYKGYTRGHKQQQTLGSGGEGGAGEGG